MRLFSYVKARYEDGVFTGVPRFDQEIREVFPGIISVNKVPEDLNPETDVVITDNHLSLDVPNEVRTIVVHHGCAKTHWDRDPFWRTPATSELCAKQEVMFSLPNRWYVAPSAWAFERFKDRYPAGAKVKVIPHWVKPFGPARDMKHRRPVVIGDWRDTNKGSSIIASIRGRAKEIEFRALNFKPEDKKAFYLDADLYLCLSSSEGAPYAVADAEAARLRIVTTDVGFVREFRGMRVFPWEKRFDPDVAVYHIRAALKKPRAHPSYFDGYTFEEWASQWRSLVSDVFGQCDVEAGARDQETSPKSRGGGVVVGLTSGIGNSIFALPLLKALKTSGFRVSVSVETDTPTEVLWRRCSYVDQVVSKEDRIPIADHYFYGPMRGNRFRPTMTAKWRDASNYNKPEWEVFLELASKLGWSGARPDVSGWFGGMDALKADKAYDVGIIPGCKPGDLWARKRYPKMVEAAQALEGVGYKICWIGNDDDRPPKQAPGDDLFGQFSISQLPAALASCRVILGTDSGPAQLAASLGLPTVMIFTATSPVKGDPVGSRVKKLYRALECAPCQSTIRWKKCQEWICQDIPVSDVVSAVNEFITKFK